LYGLEVWRMIRDLKDRGMGNREIASHMGISRNTVSWMLKRTRINEKMKRKRGSKLDPYREQIRTLIDKHNLSAVGILEEIRRLGYDGGYTILKGYCHELKKDRRIQAVYRYKTDPGKQSQGISVNSVT
jgi:transposase